jgi:hypothetical protein
MSAKSGISLFVTIFVDFVGPRSGLGTLYRIWKCNVLCDLVLSPGADALHDPDPHADQGRARAARPQHGHAPTGSRLECHAHAPGPAALQQALLRASKAP